MLKKHTDKFRIKAYLELYETGRLKKIRDIKRVFEQIRFPEINKQTYFDLELTTRQYYFNLFGGINLERKILFALGSKRKIKFFPLHPSCQKILKDKGIPVSAFFTTISFWIVMNLFLFRGLYRLVKAILIPTGIKNIKKEFPFIYFDKLSIKNLPDFYPDGSSYDIITWYINKFNPTQKSIYHNVKKTEDINYKSYKISAKDGPLPFVSKPFKYFCSSFYMWLQHVFYLFRGKWWYALLSNDLIEANRFNFCNKNNVASKYLFYNSVTFYRPIWTYKVEKLGSSIISYFYSISEAFMTTNGYEEDSEYVGLMNWSIVLVWDQYQKDLLSSSFKSNFIVCGPIAFSGKAEIIPSKKRKIRIAIFDVAPHKLDLFFGFHTGYDFGYGHIPKIHINFINDIIESSSDYEVELYIKPKRGGTKYLQFKKYADFVNAQIKNNKLNQIHGDIAAEALVKESDIIISLPFTTTGVIGKLLNKKSIYYDPTCKVLKEDRAAHGLEVISGKQELSEWFKKHCNTNEPKL